MPVRLPYSLCFEKGKLVPKATQERERNKGSLKRKNNVVARRNIPAEPALKGRKGKKSRCPEEMESGKEQGVRGE